MKGKGFKGCLNLLVTAACKVAKRSDFLKVIFRVCRNVMMNFAKI